LCHRTRFPIILRVFPPQSRLCWTEQSFLSQFSLGVSLVLRSPLFVVLVDRIVRSWLVSPGFFSSLKVQLKFLRVTLFSLLILGLWSPTRALPRLIRGCPEGQSGPLRCHSVPGNDWCDCQALLVPEALTSHFFQSRSSSYAIPVKYLQLVLFFAGSHSLHFSFNV